MWWQGEVVGRGKEDKVSSGCWGQGLVWHETGTEEIHSRMLHPQGVSLVKRIRIKESKGVRDKRRSGYRSELSFV